MGSCWGPPTLPVRNIMVTNSPEAGCLGGGGSPFIHLQTLYTEYLLIAVLWISGSIPTYYCAVLVIWMRVPFSEIGKLVEGECPFRTDARVPVFRFFLYVRIRWGLFLVPIAIINTIKAKKIPI